MLGYFVGIMSIFLAVSCSFYVAMQLIGYKRWRIITRLQHVRQLDNDLGELEPMSRPFGERVLLPQLLKMGRTIESLTPRQIQKNMQERLIAAGYSQRMAMTYFIALLSVMLVVFPTLLILFGTVMNLSISRCILLGVIGLIIAVLLPLMSLNSKKARRQNQIRKSLPDMLDLLVISVEAGLGFDMALVKVTEKMQGTLSQELTNALSEIRMGKIRRMALKEMADRTGVEELISFIGAVFQADQLGVGIGGVLRVQADGMRTYRRQKIEEQAAKAPIMMLFPLVFCILPSLFIVLLGPALIQIMEMF